MWIANRGVLNPKSAISSTVPSLGSVHFFEDSSRIPQRLCRAVYADTPLRRHADTVVIFGCGSAALRPWPKRPRILKPAGISVVLRRTKVHIIPLFFDRSLIRTLLGMSAPKQRNNANQEQD
jgi:hypothetical protein